jgi:antitoxin ParD1/3/4
MRFRLEKYAQAYAACVDNSCQIAQGLAMSRQTMSFALPESMREYIDNRVDAGNHGNTSEYILDVVRRDQEEQAKKRLRDLIEEGLASGRGRSRTKADEKELLAIARGEID